MVRESYNYYQVLDVPPEANQQHIHQAYHEAKRTYSPNNPDIFHYFKPEEIRDWVDLIEEAYAVIGHPNTRRDYDRELSFSHKPPNNPQDTPQIPTTPTHQAPLPEGYKSTPVSTYKVDKKMEEMIAHHEPVDGLFLKKVRIYKNIELTEFSRVTCIAVRHLYAIENNNFSVLPAPVFVRGYIIQYCRILDLEQNRVLPKFMSLLCNDQI